jgi:hypothetical protein
VRPLAVAFSTAPSIWPIRRCRAGLRFGSRYRRQGPRQSDRHAGVVCHGVALFVRNGREADLVDQAIAAALAGGLRTAAEMGIAVLQELDRLAGLMEHVLMAIGIHQRRGSSERSAAGWSPNCGGYGAEGAPPFARQAKFTLLAEPRQIETSRERRPAVNEWPNGVVHEQRGIPHGGEPIFDIRLGVI